MGNAFLSVGPDCVGAGIDCRIDGLEKNLDWLPGKKDPEYGAFFGPKGKFKKPGSKRKFQCFSYSEANLYRAFGADWKTDWQAMMVGQLKKHGMNTLGNWSDSALFGTTGIPYVTSLPKFPDTKQFIFRDFPDVFSKEYERNSDKCAEALKARANDPWMIGYFLRNEPSWAFVDNLVLADEVLYNPAETCCKKELIHRLEEKYHTIKALNRAWKTDFADFGKFMRIEANATYEDETGIKYLTISKWCEDWLKEKFEKNNFSDMITIENIFKDMPEIELNENNIKQYLNGVKIVERNQDGIYRIYYKNEFNGIGILKDNKLKRDLVIAECGIAM